MGELHLKVLNFKMSQTRVFNFLNDSITGTPLRFTFKLCQTSQNTPPFFKKKKVIVSN
jgi:hypothetical protein